MDQERQWEQSPELGNTDPGWRNRSATLRGGRRSRRVYAYETPPSVILLSPFSVPFKNQSGAWRNETSFGLNNLKALVNVAREAKEWISAHALKR